MGVILDELVEVTLDGYTSEKLLATVKGRLESLQVGPSCCRENAMALDMTIAALSWLKFSAENQRSVGGTLEK